MSWLPATIQERLVIVLAHFVWQGVAVAALLAALVALLNLKRPSVRYASSLLAFVLMAACPFATWFVAPDIGARDVSPVLDQSHDQRATVTEFSEPEGVSSRTAHEWDVRGLTPSGSPEADEFRSRLSDDRSHQADTQSSANSPTASNWLDTLRPFEPWVIGVWLCGVGLLSLRLLLGAIGLWRWRRAVEMVPESFGPIVARLCTALSMAQPRVRVCRRVAEAVAIGLFKPMILLPAAWLAELPPDMLEAVLAHELAHVRRLDLWVNLLQRLVETLLFYHPAVWWLSRRLRVERELCCDELAATVTNDRIRYAETLEHVARLTQLSASRGSRDPAFSVAMSGREGVLLHRIRQLLDVTAPPRTSSGWLAGLLTLGLVLTIALGTFVSSRAEIETPASDSDTNLRAGRGSPDPALAPTAGLPNSDKETNLPNNANGDLRSTAKLAQPEHLPAVIGSLVRASVTMTRTNSKTGLPDPNPNGQSGAIVDARGFILTQLIVPDADHHWRVRDNNRIEYIAEFVASERQLQLSVLRIKPANGLDAVTKFAKAKPHEPLISVPSPAFRYSRQGTVTYIGQRLREGFPEHLIQTSFPVVPGEEGGLVASREGEAVGVFVNDGHSDKGTNMAVPLVDVLPFLKKVIPEFAVADTGSQTKPEKEKNNANGDLRSNPAAGSGDPHRAQAVNQNAQAEAGITAAELEKLIQASGRELFFGRMELAQEFEMLWPTKDQKHEKVTSKGTVRWLKNTRLTRIESDRMVPGTGTTELHPEQWTTGHDGVHAYSWNLAAKLISYGAMRPGAVAYSPNLLFWGRTEITFPQPMFGSNPKITRTTRDGREEIDVVQDIPEAKLSIRYVGIVPDRGYLPTRVETRSNNRLDSQIEFRDFFQPHPGVWAPKTIVWTAWSADNDANGKLIVAMSSKFTVTKLELGERAKLQDEEFQIKLPDGVKEVDAATANAAAQPESVSNDKQLTSGIRTNSYTGPGQKLVFLEDGSVAFARGLGITHADILDDHSLRAVFHDDSGASEMQTLKLAHGLDEQRQIAWSAEHNGKKYDVVATQHSPGGFLVRALISKDRKVLSGHQGFFAFDLQKPRAQDAYPSNEAIPIGDWFDPKDGGKLAITDSRLQPGTYVGVRQECRVLKGQKDVILNQLRPTRMTLKSNQTLTARFYDPQGNPQDIALKFLHGSGHARFSTWKSEIDDRVYKVEAILMSPTTCTLLLETYSQGELLSAAQEFYAINSKPWPNRAKVLSIEEARILRELEAMTSIAFENVPFNEAIGLIAKQNKLPIIIDVGQLQELKIKSDTPITLTMTDVKVRSVLDHILKLAGGDRLGYVVEDDALKITAAMAPQVKALRGEILWLDRANGLVRISLGLGDAVQNKMTFEVRAKAPANDAAAKPVVKGTIEVTRIIDANTSQARILKDNAAEPIAKGDDILLLESQPARLPPVQGEIYDAANPHDVSRLKPTTGTISPIIKGGKGPKTVPIESPPTKK